MMQINDKNQSSLLLLPVELKREVFAHLTDNEITQCVVRVCKQLNQLAKDEIFWKTRSLTHFDKNKIDPSSKMNWKQIYFTLKDDEKKLAKAAAQHKEAFAKAFAEKQAREATFEKQAKEALEKAFAEKQAREVAFEKQAKEAFEKAFAEKQARKAAFEKQDAAKK
jgi:hypothetical protein